MYDYDDFFAPSEFDQEVDAFKNTLRQSVKTEILEELERLREENEELNLLKMNFDERVRLYKEDCQRREFEAQRAIDNAKRAHFNELVNEVAPFAWCVDWRYISQEKCGECDQYRQRHFISPLGREMKENCLCAESTKEYFVKRVPVVELRYTKKGIHDVHYLANEAGEDRFSSYESDFFDDVSFESINPWRRALFHSENKARLYAAWKNKREQDKNKEKKHG